MSQIQIETTQNVDIEYTLGSILERIAAYVVDLIVCMAWGAIVLFLVFQLEDGNAALVGMLIAILPYVFYDLVSEIVMNGQSIGKRAMNIKVIKTDGSEPTLGSYVLRWLFRLIDIAIFSGVVAVCTIAIGGKGQRLGDLVAKTCVVRVRDGGRLADTVLRDFDPDYEPVFPAVDQLTDEEIEIVREVVRKTDRAIVNRNLVALRNRTSEVIAQKLGVEQQPNALRFLKTVLRDHNAINGVVDLTQL